jgi:hypothetical protein
MLPKEDLSIDGMSVFKVRSLFAETAAVVEEGNRDSCVESCHLY